MLLRSSLIVQILLVSSLCFGDGISHVILSGGTERYSEASAFNQVVYGLTLMGERDYFFGSLDALVGRGGLMQASLGFGPKLGPIYIGPGIGYSLQTISADESNAKERIQTLGILGIQGGFLVSLGKIVLRPNVLWCQRSLATTFGMGISF